MDISNRPQKGPSDPVGGVGKVVQLLIAGAMFLDALRKLLETLHF